MKNYLLGGKQFSSIWINLISSKISDEIFSQVIREVIIMFGELCKTPTPIIKENKEIEDNVFNILKNFFTELLTLCLDNKLEETINNIKFNSNNMIIEFIKNPSKYIYFSLEKNLREYIDKEIFKNSFIKEIESYQQESKQLVGKLENIIEVINIKLMEKNIKIFNNDKQKLIETKVEEILKLMSKNNEKIKKLKNKKQITYLDYNEIKDINENIEKYKLNNIYTDDNLVFYKIPLNYNKIKQYNLQLFYENKILLLPEEQKDINKLYMITNEISDNFKNKFLIRKNILSESDEAPDAGYLNVLNEKKSIIDINIKEILDFDKSEKEIFKKFKISRNIIKTSLISNEYSQQNISKNNGNKNKKKNNKKVNNEIQNYEEILFDGLKWDNLKEIIYDLEQSLKEIKNIYNKCKGENIKKINKDNIVLLKEKIFYSEEKMNK